MQLPLSQVNRSPKQVFLSELQYSSGSSAPPSQSGSPSQYQVAGIHLWSGHLKLFGGHSLELQCRGSSSLLSPQSLSPSQSQYFSTQMVVVRHGWLLCWQVMFL